jgi:hypothetical protein
MNLDMTAAPHPPSPVTIISQAKAHGGPREARSEDVRDVPSFEPAGSIRSGLRMLGKKKKSVKLIWVLASEASKLPLKPSMCDRLLPVVVVKR